MATLTKDYQLVGTGGTSYFGSTRGYVQLYAKYNSQSISDNTSNVTWKLSLVVSGGYIGDYNNNKPVVLNGTTGSQTTYIGSGNYYSQDLATYTENIPHNSDGKKDVNGSGSVNFTAWGITLSVSGSASLPTIPRYFTTTPNITLTSKTETTMTYNWTTSENCSGIVWNGGGTATFTGLNTKSGSISVSGLTANTNFSHFGTFKRSDSGLTTNSNTLTNATYSYPYCVEAQNFTIGNNLTIKFYNPLNRTMQIQMWSHTSGQFVSDLISVNGTSYTGFSEFKERLYASIPNTTYSGYNIDVHYGGNKAVKNAGTYYVDVNDCKPVFSDFDYSTDYQELTGNANTIIDGKTNTTISIPSNKKAQSKYSSSIKRYHFEIGSRSNDLIYSENNISTILQQCSSNVIRVTAIDSRGLETTVSKTIDNFKNYTPPIFSNVDIEREDGVEEKTILNLGIVFWNNNFGAKNNKIEFLKYRTKLSSSSEWNEWNNINTDLLEINENVAKLENYLIHYNGISGGFEVGIKYNIEFNIADGNETILSNEIKSGYGVTDGSVAFSILKDSNGVYHIGINGMPDLNKTLKVHGTISND